MVTLKYLETEIKVPQGWHEISLGLWERIHALKPQTYNERARYIADLCSVEYSVLRELPTDLFNIMHEHAAWIFEDMRVAASTQIEIDGVKYFIKPEDKISLGEWADVCDAQADGREAVLSNVLAILLRPAGEEYDFEKSEARQKLFADQPASKILPILVFFMESSELLGMRKKTYANLLELLGKLPKNMQILRAVGLGIKSLQIWHTMTFCALMLLLRYRLRRLLHS